MAVAPIPPSGVSIPPTSPAGAGAPAAPTENTFGKMVTDLLGEANAQQIGADKAVENLITGKTDSVHDVVLAVAKADLTFRLVLEVRNRLVDAYQEVMRMQL